MLYVLAAITEKELLLNAAAAAAAAQASASTSSAAAPPPPVASLGYGFARYISHSKDSPNLRGRVINQPSVAIPTATTSRSPLPFDSAKRYPRLCFFATRDIQAGEELTLSYGVVDHDLPWL